MSHEPRYADEQSTSVEEVSNMTESTPFLPHDVPPCTPGLSGSPNHDEFVGKMTICREEAKKLIFNAIPSLGAQLVERSLLTVPVIAVGHLSTAALAGISLGSITASVTGLSILQGLVSALDTLLPPAWKSARPELVGLWCQRMWIVMNLMLLPIFVIWFNSAKILIALGQEPEVAKMAQVYLRLFSLGLPGYSLNLITRRYFQSQDLFSIQTYIICCVAPINLLLNYLFVWGPEPIRLGYIGAPISSAISYSLVSLIALGYAVFFVPTMAWHPLSCHAFTNLGSLLRLGFSGIGQIAPEWWAWEIVSLEASSLGPDRRVSTATQSILVTSSATLYQLPSGLSNAASMRVGNLLGEGKGRRAGIATNASIVLSLFIGCVTSVVLMIFRYRWAYMFNNDPEVVKYVAAVMPIIALYQIAEGNTSITSAILRCKGDQFIGAIVSISSYYGVAIPFGYFLTFRLYLGLEGLWIGLLSSLFYGALVGTFLCLKTDWDREVEKARSRLADDGPLLNLEAYAKDEEVGLEMEPTVALDMMVE